MDGEMGNFKQELQKLREITNKLTENGYLVDRTAQWEFAFDAVPDLVIIVNPQFVIKFVNKAFAERLAVEKIDLLDKQSFSIVCDISDLNGNVCLAFDSSLDLVERSQIYIGSLGGWFDFTRTPIMDEDNDLLGYVCIFRDITDKIETKKALKISEARYSELYNTSPDMFVSVDADTALIRQCNDTLLKKLGYMRKEIIGKKIFYLYHEDCMEDVHEVFNIFVKTGDVKAAELKLKTKNGSSIDVSLNVSAVRDRSGKILYSNSIWRDITKQKLLQKRYEEIFNGTDNGVCVFKAIDRGQDFEIVDFNKAAEKIERIKKIDVLGKKVTEVFPQVEEFGLLDILRRVWDTGETEKHPPTFYNDGRVSGWKENTVHRLPDGAVVAVYRDVTDKIKIEEALQRSEEKYRKLVETTSDWVWSCDTKGVHTFSNSAVESLLGYKPNEIIGKSALEFVYHEDVLYVKNMLQESVKQRKGWQEDVIRWVHKDGFICYIESRADPVFDSKGALIGFVGMDRDVTKRIKLKS